MNDIIDKVTAKLPKNRWSKEEDAILLEEIAKASNKQEAIAATAEKTSRSLSSVMNRYYHVLKQAHKKSKNLQVPGMPTPKLSSGAELMQKLLSSEIAVTEIILNRKEMIIRF